MSFIKTTEQASKFEHLEKMSVNELLTHINTEDKKKNQYDNMFKKPDAISLAPN